MDLIGKAAPYVTSALKGAMGGAGGGIAGMLTGAATGVLSKMAEPEEPTQGNLAQEEEEEVEPPRKSGKKFRRQIKTYKP